MLEADFHHLAVPTRRVGVLGWMVDQLMTSIVGSPGMMVLEGAECGDVERIALLDAFAQLRGTFPAPVRAPPAVAIAVLVFGALQLGGQRGGEPADHGRGFRMQSGGDIERVLCRHGTLRAG